jgi:hypothetical protein
MATSPPPGVFAKGTHYRLTYFSYVQRAYTCYYTRQNLQVNSWESQSVEVDQKITHLFFADDSFLFCKANPNDVAQIQDILIEYESASGQQINRQKTTIFFSKSTP